MAAHGYPTSTRMAVPGAKIGGAADEATQISATGADVAVIELGTNDASGYPTGQPTSGSDFVADYRTVLEAVRSARPQARLVLLSVWQQNAEKDLNQGASSEGMKLDALPRTLERARRSSASSLCAVASPAPRRR